MRALRFLLRKEYLQIFRDKTLLRMLFLIPVVQLLVLSNAATFEVRQSRLFVVDRDRSTMSRGAIDRLVASGRFERTAASVSIAAADAAMRERRVEMIVVIPEGFERGIVRDHRATVQLLLNAEDGSAAGVSQAYARQILSRYAADLGGSLTPPIVPGGAHAEAAPGRARGVLDVRTRGLFNAELNYKHYMVPGILIQLLTIIGTLLTAMNIVREKEAGTLEQLNVTPVSRPVFIAAKLIPLWTLAMLVLAIGLFIGWIAFGVPMRGSLLLVFFGGAIYLVVALGIGLWISTVVETQQQAMFVAFALLMIYLLMSGLFTPVNSMPPWAQVVADANPMRHEIELMRAVMLKGAGLADVARHLVVMAVSGVLVLTIAVRQYHKRSA